MAQKKKSPALHNQFVEWITVSSRGQIAIPVDIRKKLDIKAGDQLLIILRKDKGGINLIRKEALDRTFQKFST